MSNEREVAGASYIITFYREVQILTHNFGNYINLMLEVKNKHGNPPKDVPAEVHNVIAAQVQQVRLGVMKTYIMYKSICVGAGIKATDKDLDDGYIKIKNTFVMDMTSLESYVILLNTALVNDVIKSLLATGESLFKGVYDTPA